MRGLLIASLMSAIFPLHALAQTSLSWYYDTRNGANWNLQAVTRDVEFGSELFEFEFFGFVDVFQDHRMRVDGAYFEIRPGLEVMDSPFSIQTEFNAAIGPNRTTGLFGIGYRWGPAQIRIMPIALGDEEGQVSVGWFKQWDKFRDIRFEGFVDVQYNPFKVVTEPQISIRLFGPVRAQVEGRFNHFLTGDKQAGVGFGLGVEW